jgi:hypothetical protein
LLLFISLGVAFAVAVYWDLFISFCADCPQGRLNVDNILRLLLGGEAAVAGVLFFLGGLTGLYISRRRADDA